MLVRQRRDRLAPDVGQMMAHSTEQRLLLFGDNGRNKLDHRPAIARCDHVFTGQNLVERTKRLCLSFWRVTLIMCEG